MPEARLGGHLLGDQLSVVHEQVGVRGEVEHRVVVRAEAVRARAEHRRAVVGHVGERAPPVADPVADRPAALVRDLPGLDGEPLGLELAGRHRGERPVTPQLSRRDREEGRRHHPGQQPLSRPASVAGGPALVRQQQPDPRVVPVAAAEERQPEAVIPVQVGQQDRARERRAAQQPGGVRQPGSGVKQEHRAAVAVMRHRDARRVAPVTDVGGAGRGGGAAHPAEGDQHRFRPLPAGAGRTARRAPTARARPRRPRPPCTA